MLTNKNMGIYSNCILLTLTLCVIVFGAPATSNANDGGDFELLILHNNDMHARFDETGPRSDTCGKIDRQKGRCYGGFARVGYL